MEIKVVKKYRYTSDCEAVIGEYYGILIDYGDRVVQPIYPFTLSLNDLDSLEEFIAEYEENIFESFKNRQGMNFWNDVIGYDTELKQRVKRRWYLKGVIMC